MIGDDAGALRGQRPPAHRYRDRAGLGEGSLAENLAKLLLPLPVASGLQTVSAIDLSSSEPPDQDALICGDDPGVKKLVLELAARLVGGRAVAT